MLKYYRPKSQIIIIMQMKIQVVSIAVLAVVVAAPLATLASILTHHSAEAQVSSAKPSIPSSIIGSLLKGPFTNTYNLMSKGK